MDNFITAIFSVIAAGVTGLFTWLATRMTQRGQLQVEEVKASGPEWQSFTSTVLQRVDALEEEVKSLRHDLDIVTRARRVLVDHIWQWRRKYPKDELTLDAPEAVVREL